jgi:hypothetical protein
VCMCVRACPSNTDFASIVLGDLKKTLLVEAAIRSGESP